MRKEQVESSYDELSYNLQTYLDAGCTKEALEYCQKIIDSGNPYGYMFMGGIYEEGHGAMLPNYAKALYCYEMAQKMGVDMIRDIALLKEKNERIKKNIKF